MEAVIARMGDLKSAVEFLATKPGFTEDKIVAREAALQMSATVGTSIRNLVAVYEAA